MGEMELDLFFSDDPLSAFSDVPNDPLADPLAVRLGYHCHPILMIMWARGVMQHVDSGEFDAIFETPLSLWAGYTVNKQGSDLSSLLPGDWAVFYNAPGVADFRIAYENVLVFGDDSYWGWPASAGNNPQSHLWWREYLKDGHGNGANLGDVPGYTGEATALNFAKIAQHLFDHRTGQ